jgi:hypothetical protein
VGASVGLVVGSVLDVSSVAFLLSHATSRDAIRQITIIIAKNFFIISSLVKYKFYCFLGSKKIGESSNIL